MQKCVNGLFFMPQQYVFRMCFESPLNEDGIQPKIQVPTQPGCKNGGDLLLNEIGLE